MCAVTEQTSDLAGRWEALLRKERLALGHVQASPAGQAGSLITKHFKIVTTLKETGGNEQAITRGSRKPAATNRLRCLLPHAIRLVLSFFPRIAGRP